MILKDDGGDLKGIGLVEFLWKTVVEPLNHYFTSATEFHDIIPGFWAEHGTGTASLEANLTQQITAMM